ncbi:MAG: tetratricopeptide repeat protein, partial [bacterium]
VTTERGAWRTEGKTQNSKLKTQNYLYLFAFTLGLSFTHHMQTVYLVPASIFFIIAVYWKKWMQQKQSFYSLLSTLYPLLLKMLCLFILPLFLYLYLPIRASADPVYNWSDPDTLRKFTHHISGQSFKEYFTSGINGIYKNLTHIPHFLSDQFHYFWWMSLIGLLILLFKNRSRVLFFFLIIIVNISLAVRYSIPNIEDYYIPSYIIFMILFSLCSGFIINKFLKKGIIFSILFFIVPIISFIIHYPYNNRSNYYFAYDYGNGILCPVDNEAIMFLSGDAIEFPVCYLKYCENQRDDVALIFTIFLTDELVVKEIGYCETIKKQYPEIDLSTPIQNDEIDYNDIENSVKRIKIKEIISNKLISRPVFLMYDNELLNNYILIPKGFFYKIVSKEIKEEKICEELKTCSFHLFIRGIKDDNMIFKDAAWTLRVIINYVLSYYIHGFIYYKELGKYEESIDNYEKALEIKIKNKEIPYFVPYSTCYNHYLNEYKRNIEEIKKHLLNTYWEWGNYYEKKGLILKAIDLYKKVEEISPDNIKLKNTVGYLYFSQNRYQDAINEFKESIEICPTDVRSHINLASVYYAKGLYKEAISECKCILELDADNTYANQMLETILKRRLDK